MKMKNVVNKALVWLLVMSIISSGMGTFLPDAAVLGTMHAAKAESAPIPEAFSLDEQPLGDEQTSSEWRYALREEDGYAIITGYDGETEASLKVPVSLDGADVVGIAEGALDIAGLWHVTLNGNIMYIAEGAFGSARACLKNDGMHKTYRIDPLLT